MSAKSKPCWVVAAILFVVLAAVRAAVADPLQDASLAHDGKHYETALNLWRPLAEQGDREAQKWLGRLYDSGLGVPKDQAKAAFWYRYAAEQGDVYAQKRLGQIYVEGSNTVTRDTRIGLMWLKMAADHGDIGAQNSLGFLYALGWWGVPKDDARASAWYRKAAEAGDRSAMLRLSTAALLRKDYPEAMLWTRKQAELGKHSAELTLGTMYIEGLGVPKDIDKALFWLRKAADQTEDNLTKNFAEMAVSRLINEGTSQ